MNRTGRISLAVIAAAFLLTPVVLAQAGRDKGRPREAAGQDQSGGTLFSAEEKRLIRDWFGQAKIAAEPLPPGIAKNLARGKPLPPGIAKKVIPAELLGRLPSRPAFELLLVGTDVVLVKSGVVTDILVGVTF
jgi:hypothetical protein